MIGTLFAIVSCGLWGAYCGRTNKPFWAAIAGAVVIGVSGTIINLVL